VMSLTRPEKLNAWTRRMSRELVDAIDDGNDSDAIGAFVFTGAGRGFCAGADIGGEFASRSSADDLDRRGASSPGDGGRADENRDRDWVGLARSSKPMVAAINGVAVGVGLTMVLPMDQLLAGRSARLSARFVRMGAPACAGERSLVRRDSL